MTFILAAFIAAAASANSVLAQNTVDPPSNILVGIPSAPVYAGTYIIGKLQCLCLHLKNCNDATHFSGQSNGVITFDINPQAGNKVPIFYAFNYYITSENGTAIIPKTAPAGTASYGRLSNALVAVYALYSICANYIINQGNGSTAGDLPWSNTTGEFVAPNATTCSTIVGPGAMRSAIGNDWVPGRFAINLREIVYTGSQDGIVNATNATQGANNGQGDNFCISPPFTSEVTP